MMTELSGGAFPGEDALLPPPCCLEAGSPRPPPARRPFPRAEACVVGGVFCGFLVATGVTVLSLHYTLESRLGSRPLTEHLLRLDTRLLGLAFLGAAGALVLGALVALVACKVSEVLEMASRYREHREFCAYEDLRQSFRSQHSVFAVGRGALDNTNHGRCSADSVRGTPRK